MVALVTVGQAAVIKSIGICGVDPDCVGVIGDRVLIIATAGVSIAAMHVSCGVSRIGPDRLAMILHSLIEIALELPLIGAVAVDQCEIAPVIPAGIKEARAGLDGSVAGYVRKPRRRPLLLEQQTKRQSCRSDQRESSFERLLRAAPNAPLFGQGLFNCSPRFVLQLLLCCCPGQRGTTEADT